MTKMVTHSKIVDSLYILHENMQFYILKKYVSDKYLTLNFFKHFRKYIFNNVLMNQSFMDFLIYVPFFCTAVAAAVTEILNVCL
jgi:hypothetical protein